MWLALAGFVAGWVLLAQLHLALGWSFASLRSMALVWLVSCLGFGGWLIAGASRAVWTPFHLAPTRALIALCLLGSFLALGWVRPDSDDVNMIGGRAVYFAAHPDAPLDLVYHHISAPFPVEYKLLFPQTIDLFWGFVAWLPGVSVLDADHVLFPALAGFLIPLAWYTVLRRFTRTQAGAVAGASVIVAFLCLDGAVHRSFGNLAFVRIWQGKAVLLSIFIPVFTAFSWDFFERPHLKRALRLALLGVVATGLSSTALPLVSLLALVLGLAAFLSAPSWARLRTTVAYGSTQAFLVAVGVGLALWIEPSEVGYLGNSPDFSHAFSTQFGYVYTSPTSPTTVLMVASLAVALALVDRPARRFIAWWVLGMVGLVLNPLVMSLIAEHLTSYNIYWRLFYAAPFPLVLGVATGQTAERWLGRLSWGMPLGALALVALVCGMTVLRPSSSVYGKLRFDPGAHKVPERVAEDVAAILSEAPAGPMLAPLPYRTAIPLYDADHSFPTVRFFFVWQAALALGQAEAARPGLEAAGFVDGGRKGFDGFVRTLPGLETVVIYTPMSHQLRVRKALADAGFERRSCTERFCLYVKGGA